jgi:iron complex outermembrane recepter protein
MALLSKYLAAACLALPLTTLAQDAKALKEVIVNAAKPTALGTSELDAKALAPQRAASSDSARLLQDMPGVSLYGAGGVSSLPAIHGLADDRIRIQVDGMDLVAACPNHMNSALSYIDPTKVGSVSVFAGITPVSVGGDSIGGTIQVKSAPPVFAGSEEQVLATGLVGSFYRSNGDASGYNLGANYVGQNVNLSYSLSSAQSGNYLAASGFKAAGPGTAGGPWLGSAEVGSSKYTADNQDLGLALRHDNHLLQLNIGSQHIPFEGFPNQRMDMTGNDSTQVNLRYNGKYGWGQLEARVYGQDTVHAMNMGSDRFSYGTLGMPMNTKAKTVGAQLQAEFWPTDSDTVRVGSEMQTYTLYDWWPQAGGVMGPNAFWNVDYGTRDRAAVFSEWEAQWGEAWLSQLGLRMESVNANAGAVQGYNAQGIWSSDAVPFNAIDRQRLDANLDWTALARYTPDANRNFEAGVARKSHAPSLYQRYPWSTQAMAALMNNFVGDGNGYVGNPALKPEVAHTVSLSGDWHAADQQQWGVKATAYVTAVQDFIDAKRCNSGQCAGAINASSTQGFVILQYVNQSARLYGMDLSGHRELAHAADLGRVTARAVMGYVNGRNLSTDEPLYNIMPLHTKLSLVQVLGRWNNTLEVQWVAEKNAVSRVRNEMQTQAYSLLNLRSSYTWKTLRIDVGLENALNRWYALPLGGAYVGQGASMTSGGIPWGVVTPGMGRSVNLGATMAF